MPNGQMGYVVNHDYKNIRAFPSPWYPDGGSVPKKPIKNKKLRVYSIMYIVKFVSEDKQISINSYNIFYNELFLSIEINDKIEMNISNYDFVIIFVNNKFYLSEVLSISFYDLHINKNFIYIKINEILNNYEVIENNIFKFINLMIKQNNRSWLGYSEEDKFYWLRSCFFYNRKHYSYNKKLIIYNNFIKTKNDFLCEFSENLIGIGGYFGSDLDGFDDCFDLYKINDIGIEWVNFYENDFSYKKEIVDIILSRNIRLIKK